MGKGLPGGTAPASSETLGCPLCVVWLLACSVHSGEKASSHVWIDKVQEGDGAGKGRSLEATAPLGAFVFWKANFLLFF